MKNPKALSMRRVFPQQHTMMRFPNQKGAIRTWDTVTATNQNVNQDESGLSKGDSTSFDVGGKLRQTNARRVSYLNKSASGNHLGRNDPHPPAAEGRKSRASRVTGQVPHAKGLFN
jgi:hypothetical protein